MGILESYEGKLGLPQAKWTKTHWREFALDLAQSIDSAKAKPKPSRGRPRTAASLSSAKVNYQALAWQVKQQIDFEAQAGRKLKTKDIVKAEMLASVKWSNEQGEKGKTPIRNGLVPAKLDTAYTEVRKILATWRKAEKEREAEKKRRNNSD